MYFDVLNTEMTMKIGANEIYNVTRKKNPNKAKDWKQTQTA